MHDDWRQSGRTYNQIQNLYHYASAHNTDTMFIVYGDKNYYFDTALKIFDKSWKPVYHNYSFSKNHKRMRLIGAHEIIDQPGRFRGLKCAVMIDHHVLTLRVFESLSINLKELGFTIIK